MVSPTVIYTKKDFYLMDAINHGIDLFKSAGLVDFWRSQDTEKRPSIQAEQGAKLLTMNQLMGSFMILIFGCVAGFVAFLAENLKVKFRRISSDMLV